MSLRVSNVAFSEFSKFNNGVSIPQGGVQTPMPSMQPATVEPPELMPPNKATKSKEKNFIKDNLSYINSGLVFITLGLTTLALAKGRGQKVIQETSTKINELGNRLNEMASDIATTSNGLIKATDKIDSIETRFGDMESQITSAVSKADGVVTKQEQFAQEYAQKIEYYDNHFNAIDEGISNLHGIQNHSGVILERNIAYIDGLPLVRNLANDGRTPIELPKSVKKWLSEAANAFIYKGEKQVKPRPLTKDSTVWSVTSEAIPEKEGGLGEVPVQIAKNLTKEFDINNYIVKPMVQWPEKAQLVEKAGEQTIYRYNINGDKKFEMPVDKVAEFKMDVMRNGRFETQNVEVYVGIDPQYGYKRLMFKNDDYFGANGIYKATYKVSEPERFAMFNKAVYEFMKMKVDPNSATHLKICNTAKYNEIKAPDAMILNDWQAGGLAGLLRLKAPCEAGMGELSATTAETFKTMNLININHNLDYQGFGGEHGADILNTLFDKYTYDIYKYADTPFGFSGINKVLTIDGNANLAYMGACLSNTMKPVSPNYAKELAEEFARSGSMQHICNVRLNQGTMVGASNGWDRVLNEVSDSEKNGYINALNSDKVAILAEKLKSIAPILDSKARQELNGIINAKDMDAVHLEEKIAQLKNIESPTIKEGIREMETSAFGIKNLREIRTYTHEDSIDTIMVNRRHNKKMFIDFINDMVEYTKNKGEKPFHIGEAQLTDISDVTAENIDDTIVYNMGVRFVSQKGVDVACDAITKVMREWETRYPNKPKPIFVLGGVDAENGQIKSIVRAMKQNLDPKYSKRVVWQDAYTKNNIWQAGSDFTLYPSHFEPDGAKWESLYKGTPVVCTSVGGHGNSVNDGVNGFLTKRTVPQIKSALGIGDITPERMSKEDRMRYVSVMGDDFAEAIWRSVETYYNKEAYANMVRASIDGNQSWIIKDGNGNITGGALLGHMKDLGFEFNDFPAIQLKQAA